jgi:glutathione S-transferase
MIFYDCATAPSPRRARMVLAEKGLEVETRQVDLRSGEQLGDVFRAINPRATVPVLVVDADTVLTENLAIAAYLEEIAPSPQLFGAGPKERALVWQWVAICEQQGLMALGEALRNGSAAMKDRALPGPEPIAQIPQLATRGRVRFGRFKSMLNAHLADHAYLANDAFSYADITAFVVCDYAKVIGMAVDGSEPYLQNWMSRIKERKSAQA